MVEDSPIAHVIREALTDVLFSGAARVVPEPAFAALPLLRPAVQQPSAARGPGELRESMSAFVSSARMQAF